MYRVYFFPGNIIRELLGGGNWSKVPLGSYEAGLQLFVDGVRKIVSVKTRLLLGHDPLQSVYHGQVTKIKNVRALDW